MSVDILAALIVVIILLVAISVTGVVGYSLVSGSWKRYAEKRADHLEQLDRVRRELQEFQRGGRH